MAVAHHSRVTDLGAILTEGSSGFVTRKRTGIGLFFHLFMLGFLIVLGTSLIVYFRSIEGSLLAVVIGLCLTVIAHNVEKLKKQIQSIEFMNALFSSALGDGYKFCFIVKNTGHIVFYNRSFQSVFPAFITQDIRTIESLLNLYTVPEAERNRIHGFISSNSAGSVNITLRTSETAERQAIEFYIEPIERPTGFFLIRGK